MRVSSLVYFSLLNTGIGVSSHIRASEVQKEVALVPKIAISTIDETAIDRMQRGLSIDSYPALSVMPETCVKDIPERGIRSGDGEDIIPLRDNDYLFCGRYQPFGYSVHLYGVNMFRFDAEGNRLGDILDIQNNTAPLGDWNRYPLPSSLPFGGIVFGYSSGELKDDPDSRYPSVHQLDHRVAIYNQTDSGAWFEKCRYTASKIVTVVGGHQNHVYVGLIHNDAFHGAPMQTTMIKLGLNCDYLSEVPLPSWVDSYDFYKISITFSWKTVLYFWSRVGVREITLGDGDSLSDRGVVTFNPLRFAEFPRDTYISFQTKAISFPSTSGNWWETVLCYKETAFRNLVPTSGFELPINCSTIDDTQFYGDYVFPRLVPITDNLALRMGQIVTLFNSDGIPLGGNVNLTAFDGLRKWAQTEWEVNELSQGQLYAFSDRQGVRIIGNSHLEEEGGPYLNSVCFGYLNTTNLPGNLSPITGVARVGGALTAGQVTLDPQGPVSDISYQWFRFESMTSHARIEGATSHVYTPVSEDIGKRLAVKVFYTDPTFYSHGILSRPTSLIKASNTLSQSPTRQPTWWPTLFPTKAPSSSPITTPSVRPTLIPSRSPSLVPTTAHQYSLSPTGQPSAIKPTGGGKSDQTLLDALLSSKTGLVIVSVVGTMLGIGFVVGVLYLVNYLSRPSSEQIRPTT